MAKNKDFQFKYGSSQESVPAPAQNNENNSSEVALSAKTELINPSENKAITDKTKTAKAETNNTRLAAESENQQIKITGQLTMQPKQKKKKDKAVNFLVNDSDYQEFTQICKKLGYSNNEVINYLLTEFIKANKS